MRKYKENYSMYMDPYSNYPFMYAQNQMYMPDTMKMPKGIQRPNGNYGSNNVQVPSGNYPPNNIPMPGGNYPPNNIQMPNGNYSPNHIQVPRKDDSEMCEKDEMYMKSMYPDLCKKLQAFIDEACDKMEYEGSLMYDEYPDKEAVELITDQICNQVDKDNLLKTKETDTAEEIGVSQRGNYWLRDLAKVLLLNEIFRRRYRRYPDRYNKYNYYYNDYGKYNRRQPYYPMPYDYLYYFD